jgi:hypothetical protein
VQIVELRAHRPILPEAVTRALLASMRVDLPSARRLLLLIKAERVAVAYTSCVTNRRDHGDL